MVIKLKDYEVKIKESMTWGEKEKLQAIFVKGAKLTNEGIGDFDTSVIMDAKYYLLEFAITEIKKGEEIIPYSKEWASNLSIEDGDKLYSTIDEVMTPTSSASKKKE